MFELTKKVFLVIIFLKEKHVQTITVSSTTIVRWNLTLNASDITFFHAIVIAFWENGINSCSDYMYVNFICLVDTNFLCFKKCITDICFQKYCLLHISGLDNCRTYCQAKWCVFAFIPTILIKSKYSQRNDWKTYPVRWRLWK